MAHKPDFLYGKLENGLTYYVRQSLKQPGKANFYLIEKAGSINETPEESGLAHFLEHLAFKGTTHFPGTSLIDSLAARGVEFGPDLNAATSFDKTTFRIENVATDMPNIQECLLVLRDWGGGLLLLDEDINAERGVITEEWRTTSSPTKRIRAQLATQLLEPGNPWATHPPIGNMEVVDTFQTDQLRNFYNKWYRPDLQAVVVEGDINPEETVRIIQENWANTKPEDETPIFIYPKAPEADSALVALAFDRDLRQNSIDIQFYEPSGKKFLSTEEYEIRKTGQDLVATMIGARLRKRLEADEKPFMAPGSYFDEYTVMANVPAFTLGATFSGDNWEKALEALATESKRVTEHGFSPEETDFFLHDLREQSAYLESLDPRKYNLSDQFINNFIYGEPIIDLQSRRAYLKEFINRADTALLNSLAREMIHSDGHNTAIMIRGKDLKHFTSEEDGEALKREIKTKFQQSLVAETEPFEFITPRIAETKEFMTELPRPGKIEREAPWILDGVKLLSLSNGSRVWLVSDSTARGVRVVGVSPGGYSRMSAEDYPQYSVMNEVMTLGGLGDLSADEVKRTSAAKQIEFSATVGPVSESFLGYAPAARLENLLQAMYLRFSTYPQNEEAFKAWQNNYRNGILRRQATKMGQISDSIAGLLYGSDNPRMPVPQPALADSADYGKINSLFKERFENVADFDFIIAGNFQEETLKPLIERYIASLPGDTLSLRESYDATSIPKPRPFKGEIKINSQGNSQGNSQATSITHTLNADVEYNLRNRLAFSILRDLLSDYLIREIRQKEGAAYRFDISGDISQAPSNLLTLVISFDTNEGKADKALEILNSAFGNIASEDIDPARFNGIKKRLQDDFSSYRPSSDFKVNLLKDYILQGTLETLDYPEILDSITPGDIKKLAATLAAAPTIVDLVVVPYD